MNEIHNDSGYFFAPYVHIGEKVIEETQVAVDETDIKQKWKWYFWKFVHNFLIHPLLAFPLKFKWVQRAHDWTAERCKC